jgi:membrane-bound metal-dependent hydrolase YbcI (DUF457 family)
VFVGHLAVAFGARAAEPRVPLAVAVAAGFALDLLWPILLLLGLESVRVQPGDTAFTSLAFDSYPWSHSLALVLLWSAVAGVAARRLGSARAAAIVAGLVLSHWVLDWVTHRPDLPLWPWGPVVGLGLWNSVPATIAVEGALLVIGLTRYLRSTVARDAAGRWSLAALVTIATALWITQPWSPPPPSSTAVAIGSLVLWGIVPWARSIDRHRR